MSQLFDGTERTENKIEMFDASGLIIQQEWKTEDEALSTELDPRSKKIQNYILLNRNKYKMARPGDKTREPFFSISGIEKPIDGRLLVNNSLNVKIWEIYKGYIKADFERIKASKDPNFVGNSLVEFSATRGITDFIKLDITEDTDIDKLIDSNEEVLKKAIIDYFQKQIKQEKIELDTLRLTDDTVWYSKLGTDLDTIVDNYVVNQTIIWAELSKLFNGDLAFYSDYYKRNSNILSTGKLSSADESIIDALNTLSYTNLQHGLLLVKEQYGEMYDSMVLARDNKKRLTRSVFSCDAFHATGI